MGLQKWIRRITESQNYLRFNVEVGFLKGFNRGLSEYLVSKKGKKLYHRALQTHTMGEKAFYTEKILRRGCLAGYNG